MSRRQKWTEEEDEMLRQVMALEDAEAAGWERQASWERLARRLEERGYSKSAKQVKERWQNHLCSRLSSRSLSSEENRRLFELHRQHKNHWKKIAESFPGKTDNNIKNQFFALIRKSLRKAGKNIDQNPNTEAINFFKPKVLSDFLLKHVTLKQPLSKPGIPWLNGKPIDNWEFITFFAFNKQADIHARVDAEVRAAIKAVFDFLNEENSRYQSGRDPPESRCSSPRASREPSQAPGAAPSEAHSLRLVANRLFFYSYMILTELRANPPHKFNLVEALNSFAKAADGVRAILERGGERDVLEFHELFHESRLGSLNLAEALAELGRPRPEAASLIDHLVGKFVLSEENESRSGPTPREDAVSNFSHLPGGSIQLHRVCENGSLFPARSLFSEREAGSLFPRHRNPPKQQ